GRVPGGLERSPGGPGTGRPRPRDAGGTYPRRAGRGWNRRRGCDASRDDGAGNGRMRRLWHTRELSTVAILALEIAFFTWYLWPGDGRPHPFLNPANGLLVLKYSSIYGIAAVGAAIVIICGGIDLAPGAIIALSGVVAGGLFVD